MRKVLVLVTLILAMSVVLPVLATAQTVINPVTVQFTPSADHAALAIDGNPMVAKYEMRIYTEANPTVVLTVTDIGKPTPVSNLITITNAVWFSALTPNTKYIARVAAVGPSGEGVSDPSNPFGNVGAPAKPTAVTVKK
jgi:hypothetical protein